MTNLEPVLIVDPEVSLPPGQRLFTTPEMYDEEKGRPHYTMATVAQVFFFRSTAWLRKHMRPQKQADGSVVRHNESGEFGLVVPPRTASNHHAWRLWDIERLGYAFLEHGVIQPSDLQRTLKVIKIEAQGWGYLA